MTDMQTGSATYGAPRHLSLERPEPARPNGYVGRRRAPEALTTSPVQPEQVVPVAARYAADLAADPITFDRPARAALRLTRRLADRVRELAGAERRVRQGSVATAPYPTREADRG